MIISLNWLKRFVDIDLPTDKLVELIGSRLVEVEGTEDLSKKYQGIKIVEVLSAEKIEGSDHLTRCMVFDGKTETQVVCGAPNVRAGMLAVWLTPGTVLPATYNEEPLVLDKRKLMGVESAGMLAAMDELDLGESHDGIIEIDPKVAKPGDDFAKVFELNDTLLDIENKSLTHRPDCFGVIGFAREVAGVLGQKFVEPEILKDAKLVQISGGVDLNIEITDSKLCPRYCAAVVSGAGGKESKYLSQMQVDIAKAGMHSISRIVDITNYLMLLTGQPLHAFDYDKLLDVGGEKTARIIVRPAKKGEKLELLDGKVVECDTKDILITSNNRPVALAGAMGGANTAIDENTKRIIIESATFNLFNMRGTQFRHGIFSEAITRFTKGQPEGLATPTLNEAIKMVGGKVDATAEDYPKPIKIRPIEVPIELVNDVLGTSYDFNEIITTLENVGFKATIVSSDSRPELVSGSRNKQSHGSRTKPGMTEGTYLQVKAPWWRTDIHIAEDVIEEVGRLKGYTNIPLDLPQRGFVAPTSDELGEFKNKLRNILSGSGCNEILTYSFVSGRLLDQVGQDPKNSYKIINSISPKLQYVRQSLTPSILEKTWLNTKVPYEHFALFEINQVYQKAYGLTNEKVPALCDKVALVVCDRKAQGSAHYEALKQATNLLQNLNIKFDIVPMNDVCASNAPYEPKRSAQIKTLDHKTCFGAVGEFRRTVLKNLKLPEYTAGFEFNVNKLMENVSLVKPQKMIEEAVKNDVTFKVDSGLEYRKLEVLIQDLLQARGLQYEIEPVSIYQGDDKKFKNISFALSFASYDKTLETEEIIGIMDDITSEVKKELKGEII